MLSEGLTALNRIIQRGDEVHEIKRGADCTDYYVGGECKLTHRQTNDVLQAVEFLNLDSLVESCKTFEATGIWISDRNVVVVYAYEDDSEKELDLGYGFGFYSLRQTEGWETLLQPMEKDLKPKEVVSLMRHEWRGNIGEDVRSIFSNVRFAVSSDEENQTAHTGDSLGRSVHTNAASGGEGIPEEISWQGQRWIGVDGSYNVPIVVTARPEKGKILLRTPKDAVASVELLSINHLAQQVDALKKDHGCEVEVHIGRPPAITRQQYVDRYREAII